MVKASPKYSRIKQKTLCQKILAKVFIYFILLLMYAPILYLIVYSFNDAKIIGSGGQFSFKPFTMLFSSNNPTSEKIWSATFNTLNVALVSSTLATILGSMGAIGIYYSKKVIKNTLNTINQIPVVNAEIVMALSLTILFVTLNLERSFWTLIAGHMVLSIPFVVLSVQPKLTQMDPNLYEAAMDLGATPTQALFKIICPEILPGIISGFMLSFTLSLDDYIITYFTKPSKGFETISTYVEAVTKKQGLPLQLRALTTIIFVVILIIMIIYNVVIKNKLEKKGK